MTINTNEFLVAYNKVLAAHPQAKIFENKARKVLEKLAGKLARNYRYPHNEQRTYGSLVRETLNDFQLPKGPERKAYASLTGFYFGNRASKNEALNAHRRKINAAPPVKIRLDGTQSAWDF